MTDERDMTGRCGWIALGCMVFLLQGLLPTSFVGGAADAIAAGTLFGYFSGSDLALRMFVLAGLIFALLTTALAVMVLTISITRIARRMIQAGCRVSQVYLKA